LEINHPLHALAWAGAGEVLRVILLALRDGPGAVTRGDRWAAVAGTVPLLLLPMAMAVASSRVFLVTDPFLWRLHADYISEFQGLDRILGRGFSWMSVSLCLPVLLLVPSLWGACRRSMPADIRARLVLVLIPALLGWAMGWSQVRWLSLALALSVPALATGLHPQVLPLPSRRSLLGWLIASAMVFGPGIILAVQRTLDAAEPRSEDIRNLAERDLAHWLRLRAGSDRVVVVASPTPTTKLIYHGGFAGVGTLYWENVIGLKHVAEIYAARSEEAAHEAAVRLGATHLVFISWGAFEDMFVRLVRGLPPDAPLPADSFAAQLLSSPVPPPWLRQVPFKLPGHPALADQEVRVWEVVSPQTPSAALAAAANHYLELGRLEDARRLAPVLAQFADDLPALVMLAGIASRDRDAEGFALVLERIIARLRGSAALSLQEQVQLVVVLTVGQQHDRARDQLRQAVAKIDERGLRHLTPGALSDLLSLSDALGVDLPNPGLLGLARSLIPPDRRP
jgi:hypothetical protein